MRRLSAPKAILAIAFILVVCPFLGAQEGDRPASVIVAVVPGADADAAYQSVMGDRVNLASRLESLSKKYHEPLIVSDSIQRRVRDRFACRLLDRASVKGRRESTGIYTLRRDLAPADTAAWKAHDEAIALYFDGKFGEAAKGFRRVLELLPKDEHALRFLRECEKLKKAPPGPGWTGAVEVTEK
ncbi:MAG: hypothetical protein NTU62_03390 [Spirochaetes bacterium]|nr:hypothetical protein [Spirochaetota bacterium]